jgi:hypothetical protein
MDPILAERDGWTNVAISGFLPNLARRMEEHIGMFK